MAKKMGSLDMASWILCTVAAIHLGLVGAFNINVFDSVLGAGSVITKVIFVITGLLGLYSLKHMLMHKK